MIIVLRACALRNVQLRNSERCTCAKLRTTRLVQSPKPDASHLHLWVVVAETTRGMHLQWGVRRPNAALSALLAPDE
jgi:hypothetical protein